MCALMVNANWMRVFYLSGLLHTNAIALDPMAGLAVHTIAEPCQYVDMDRQVEIL